MQRETEIIVAKGAGFCFGVKRAVDIAFKNANTSRVFTLGPIIHNPQVVQRLVDMGVTPLEGLVLSDIKASDTIIIRTHGVPVDTLEALKKTGCSIIDATCPFVKKAQDHAKALAQRGYQVLIIGDRDHPEVKGLVSYAGDDVVVVSSEDEVGKLKNRVGIVVQTTQPVDTLKRVVQRVLQRVKELVVYNTICSSTDLRLKETMRLTDKVEAIFVVGGRNSANTTQLTRLCRSKNIPTYHIETVSEIQDSWLRGINKIGITAGASTPDWIINEVIDRIKYRGGNGQYGSTAKRGD